MGLGLGFEVRRGAVSVAGQVGVIEAEADVRELAVPEIHRVAAWIHGVAARMHGLQPRYMGC